MWLLAITLVYLGFPFLLFLFTWTKLPVAILCSASLGLLIIIANSLRRKNGFKMHQEAPEIISGREIALIIISSGIWTYFSGAGNFVFQNSDWIKHNVILRTLTEYSWPVLLDTGAHSGTFLNYYFGWYLIPAFVGKLAHSMDVAYVTQFIFTWIGVTLVFLWIREIMGKISFKNILFFILFATADALGVMLLGKFGLINFKTPLERWSGIGLEYSSFTTLLYWVPGQAISAWILGAVLLKAGQDASYIAFAMIIILLALFWSPFAVLGSIPFFIVLCFIHRTQVISHLHRYFPLVVSSIPLVLFFFLYYQANLGGQNRGVPIDFIHITSVKEGVRFLIFFIFEALLPSVILFSANKISRRLPDAIVKSAIALLCALPFLRLGINNDLMMRASIPALFMVYIAISQYFTQLNKRIVLYFIILTYFCIGAITPFTEFSRTAQGKRDNSPPPPLRSFATSDVVSQYMGSYDSLFFSYVLKKNAIQ